MPFYTIVNDRQTRASLHQYRGTPIILSTLTAQKEYGVVPSVWHIPATGDLRMLAAGIVCRSFAARHARRAVT